MEWIIGLSYLVFLLILTLVYSSDHQYISLSDKVFHVFITLVLSIGIIASSIVIGDKIGQKRTLRGKSDYKIEIKYELKDSIYTPVDTTFTETKH